MNDIDKINKLLSDEQKLNNYIESLEKEVVCMPKDLNKNILFKIETKRKKSYYNICKIAACLIFALAICQTDFILNDEIENYKKQEKRDNTIIEQKVSNICSFFTKPIDLGGKK